MTDASASALPPFADDPALRDFAIDRELGGGGMSRLFVATDRKLDRQVVIKVLVPAEGTLSVERFRREISVATSLQHPNIVPILAAGELGAEGRLPFLVMPYVAGESLRERLLRGPLSIREAVQVARDVTRALLFAHERGIVHRDIKPGNILLASGAAVVSDFGVAKALVIARREAGGPTSGERQRGWRGANHSLTAIGTSLGTPAYMAPEQAAADPNVDHRADIYALGIVLYEMLAGTPPFHGRSPQELLRAQLADPPPPIHSRRYDVPVALAALIARCLEKEPDRRPRNATELLRALEDPAIFTGEFARPGGPMRRALRSTAMRRVMMLGGIVLFVATAVAIDRRTGSTGPSAGAAESSVAAGGRWSRRLAIAGLRNVGGDPRAAAVAQGMESEIANAMAAVPGVRSGTQGTSAPGDSAAGLIGPYPGEPMLRFEGSVQREGPMLRVLLRAIDLPADTLLWSGAFDGHADSVLALQTRVARSAASAITAISLARAP